MKQDRVDAVVVGAGKAAEVGERLDRVLRGFGIGIQTIDGFHGRVLHSSRCCSCSSGVSKGGACIPTLSSQIEMIGTAFANNVYRSVIAANVAMVIRISTG